MKEKKTFLNWILMVIIQAFIAVTYGSVLGGILYMFYICIHKAVNMFSPGAWTSYELGYFHFFGISCLFIYAVFHYGKG